MYKTNPHTLEEPRSNTQSEISAISMEELQTVNTNVFRKYTECMWLEGQHFQNVLKHGWVSLTLSKGCSHAPAYCWDLRHWLLLVHSRCRQCCAGRKHSSCWTNSKWSSLYYSLQFVWTAVITSRTEENWQYYKTHFVFLWFISSMTRLRHAHFSVLQQQITVTTVLLRNYTSPSTGH